MNHHNSRHPIIDVSFLFISYMRSDLLLRAIDSVRRKLMDARFCYEFVIADDCSSEPHASAIKDLDADQVVVAQKRRGLGANCNQGIAACSGANIVQIQDDWIFIGTSDVWKRALEILSVYPEVGLVRLRGPAASHKLEYEIRTQSGYPIVVYKNDGIKGLRKSGERPYSDTPHIKRREFCVDMGPYKEGVAMAWTELDFEERVANQDRWKVAAFSEESFFTHVGATRSFNPVYRRARLMQAISAIPLFGAAFNAAHPFMRWLRELIIPSRRIH